MMLGPSSHGAVVTAAEDQLVLLVGHKLSSYFSYDLPWSSQEFDFAMNIGNGASESFPMSQLYAWSGQSIGVSALALVLPMNTQDWSALFF